MMFKYLLLTLLGMFFVYLVVFSRRTGWRKGFIFCFVVVMFVFAWKPDLATTMAHFVGVGRGADFLFYLSHLTLLLVAFVYYLKFRAVEARMTRLTRHVAIAEAEAAYGASEGRV